MCERLQPKSAARKEQKMESVQRRMSEVVGSGKSKESHYKWISRNEPGELTYVPKNTLLVDHRYQRELNDSKRLRIVAKFNWAAFGVLLVSRRKGGGLYVIDGQHRLAAAQSRSDVQTVPVVIFDLADSLQDEAFDFLVANKDRRPLSGIESFKAMITTGDKDALTVQRLVQAANREVGIAGPKTVACVVNLYRAVTTDAEAMERAWPTIATICEGERVDNRLVAGLFTMERKLLDQNGEKRSIAETKIRAHLVGAGYVKLMRSIGESCAYYKRGGEMVFAQGCLNVLNYKRQNKFTLVGGKGAE
jgi:hypothetical protein